MASESETVRLWFGQRRWGWRLWGVSKGDKWFVGLSIKSYADWSGPDLSIANGGTGAREEAQDAARLEWVGKNWTDEHSLRYASYVLSVGGVGDIGDMRSYVDAAIAQQDAQRGEERDDGRG